jgi:hypothetical protein
MWCVYLSIQFVCGIGSYIIHNTVSKYKLVN